MDKERAKELIEQCKRDGHVTLTIEWKTFTVNVLRKQLNLGTFQTELKLTIKDLAQMLLDLEFKKENNIETILMPNASREVLLHFQQWKPRETGCI